MKSVKENSKENEKCEENENNDNRISASVELQYNKMAFFII